MSTQSLDRQIGNRALRNIRCLHGDPGALDHAQTGERGGETIDLVLQLRIVEFAIHEDQGLGIAELSGGAV